MLVKNSHLKKVVFIAFLICLQLNGFSQIFVLLGRASDAYKIQDYETVFEKCSEIIEIDSMHYGANSMMAYSLLNIKKYKEAIPYFDKTLEVLTDDVDVWMKRADCHYNLYNHDAALADVEAALKLSPANAKSWEFKASIYMRLDEYDKAINVWTQLIDRDKDNIYLYKRRALCYQILEQSDKAKLDYEIALYHINEYLKRNPEQTNWRTTKFHILFDLGRAEKAKEFLDNSLLKFPEHVGLLQGEALYYYDLHEWKTALPYFENLVEKGITTDIFFTYGVPNCKMRMGLLEESRKEYEQLIIDFPDYSYAYCDLGIIHLLQDDLQGAQNYLKLALEKEATNPLAYKLEALIFEYKGEKDKACASMQQAKSLYYAVIVGDGDLESLINRMCNE